MVAERWFSTSSTLHIHYLALSLLLRARTLLSIYLSIYHLHYLFIINMNYEFIIFVAIVKWCHIRPLKASLWVSMSLRHASISFWLILIFLTQDVLGLYLLWTSHGVIYSSVDSWLPLVVLEINLGALGMLIVIKRTIQWIVLVLENICVYKHIYTHIYIYTCTSMGFPSGTSSKESTCQCRRHKIPGFDPWVRKIPWKRAWKSTPGFLPRTSHVQRSLTGYSPWGCKESDMTGRLTLPLSSCKHVYSSCHWTFIYHVTSTEVGAGDEGKF